MWGPSGLCSGTVIVLLYINDLPNVFKIETPPIFYNWFKLINTVHNYNTRSTFFNIDHDHISNNLFKINARTTHGFKLLKVSGPKLWNSIQIK